MVLRRTARGFRRWKSRWYAQGMTRRGYRLGGCLPSEFHQGHRFRWTTDLDGAWDFRWIDRFRRSKWPLTVPATAPRNDRSFRKEQRTWTVLAKEPRSDRSLRKEQRTWTVPATASRSDRPFRKEQRTWTMTAMASRSDRPFRKEQGTWRIHATAGWRVLPRAL